MTITGEEGAVPLPVLVLNRTQREQRQPLGLGSALSGTDAGQQPALANPTPPRVDLLVPSWASLPRPRCPAKGPVSAEERGPRLPTSRARAVWCLRGSWGPGTLLRLTGGFLLA